MGRVRRFEAFKSTWTFTGGMSRGHTEDGSKKESTAPHPAADRGSGQSWLKRGAPFAVPVLVAAGLFLLYKLVPVLELVAISALLALILRTFVLRLGRLGIRSWEAALILLGIIAAIVVFIWLVLIPNIVREVLVLSSSLPGYANSLNHLLGRLHQNLGLTPNLSGYLIKLEDYLTSLLGSIPTVLTTATGFLIDAIAILVLSLYMAHDPGSLIKGILRFVPQNRKGEIEEIIENLEARLRGWIVGLILAMLIVGGGAGVGLWILGVPLPLTLGILAGLLEVVPYFGPIIGGLLPALLALTISPLKAALVVVLFFALNQLDSHLIQPLVMGREVRLHPVVVIFSFLVFGKLLGLVGVLLAVPAAAFMVTLVDEILSDEDSSGAPSPQKEDEGGEETTGIQKEPST